MIYMSTWQWQRDIHKCIISTSCPFILGQVCIKKSQITIVETVKKVKKIIYRYGNFNHSCIFFVFGLGFFGRKYWLTSFRPKEQVIAWLSIYVMNENSSLENSDNHGTSEKRQDTFFWKLIFGFLNVLWKSFLKKKMEVGMNKLVCNVWFM